MTSKHEPDLTTLWRQVPVSQWSSHEISGWFNDVAGHVGIQGDEKEVILESLSGRTGSDLYNMSNTEFIDVSQRYGETLYHSVQREDRQPGITVYSNVTKTNTCNWFAILTIRLKHTFVG